MNQNPTWSPAAPGKPLQANEVHIWRAHLDLDSPIQDLQSASLSLEERERAARFAFDKDRKQFILTRMILRQLLGGYLGESPGRVLIETLKYGKPTLTAAAKIPSLRFNLSHSHGLALFAFSLEQEIGVDLEMIRPPVALDGIENIYFSAREREELAALPSELRAEGFFLGWTRKEAYVKALGEGLLSAPEAAEVSLTPDRVSSLCSSDRQRWSLYSLCPEAGFVGAFVVEGRNHLIRYWNLNTRIT
jgi:4'-phosphopantetheinyl transferase